MDLCKMICQVFLYKLKGFDLSHGMSAIYPVGAENGQIRRRRWKQHGDGKSKVGSAKVTVVSVTARKDDDE